MSRVLSFIPRMVFCASLLLTAAATLSAQDAPINPEASPLRRGYPEDWSSKHVIFTRNGSVADMMKAAQDPRFLNSLALHNLMERRNLASPSDHGMNDITNVSNDGTLNWAESLVNVELPPNPVSPGNSTFGRHGSKKPKVDWSVSLGPTGGQAAGETPAVYLYNYSSPTCSNLTATPAVVGDFVVYTINAAAGVGTQANLVGLTNLYTTVLGTGYCTGSGPSFLFSYAIGSGGSPLSPVMSLDGTKIAWIENRTSTSSYLHITTWVANQGVTAANPVAVTGTFSNGACTPSGSSCDDAIAYTASVYPGCPTAYTAGNSHSEIYVDYSSNSGFVSANNGLLYHIKNIFSATVAPTVDFCIPVNSSFETAASPAMSGPVFDELNSEVYITDSEKLYAYNVNTSATTPNFSAASPASYTYGNTGSGYGYPTGPGPLLDQFNGLIYLFSTYDANGNTSITQIPTSLSTPVVAQLGPKSTNTTPTLYYGAFDNNYYTYGPKNALSTFYSCGTDSTTTTAQDLFSVSFNASTGVMNTTPTMSYNKNVNPGGASGLCSPLTEFYDGTNDRLFVGMGQPGASTGANLVTMWNINSRLTNTSGTGGTMPTYTSSATGYLGGASGLSADGASTLAQAENVYFSTEQAGSTATPIAGNGYNVYAIYNNLVNYSTGGFDTAGYSYSGNLIGTSITWNGTTFTLGTSSNLLFSYQDAWANTTITLPTGSYSTIVILAASAFGPQTGTFIVNYSDGSSTSFSQTISDWYSGPVPYSGESVASTMTYRNYYNGTNQVHAIYVYGYSFPINPNKTVTTLTLPANRDIVVLAGAVSTNCGGADYCAVKLTQSALQ